MWKQKKRKYLFLFTVDKHNIYYYTYFYVPIAVKENGNDAIIITIHKVDVVEETPKIFTTSNELL